MPSGSADQPPRLWLSSGVVAVFVTILFAGVASISGGAYWLSTLSGKTDANAASIISVREEDATKLKNEIKGVTDRQDRTDRDSESRRQAFAQRQTDDEREIRGMGDLVGQINLHMAHMDSALEFMAKTGPAPIILPSPVRR